jgi:mycofactocin system creatininase family protein
MGPARSLADLTWIELAARSRSLVLAVPVGSTEQHGPHLPLSTDTDIAIALSMALASAREDVVVAPAVAFGAAGEHASFAGTLSIGTPATQATLVELGRSADAFAGVVFVSAHGGNTEAVAGAVGLLGSESRLVRAWAPSSSVDAHAGRTETSVMLALRPGAVRLDAMSAGCTQPLGSIMPSLRTGGVAAVSTNGVLGDPTGASVTEGGEILAAWTADLVASLAGWP